MQNKKQLKSDLKATQTVKSTMNVLSHNKSLVEELQVEFTRMVENLQLDVLSNLNHKEYQDEKWTRVQTTRINGDYLQAFIVFCDITNNFRGL